MHEYKAKIIKVIDGDTFKVLVDLGFKVYIEINLRLYGVNAPETRTRSLKEKIKGYYVKGFMKGFLEGETVTIKTIKTKAGKNKKTFSRYLAKVYWGNNNIDICEMMISEELATIYK